MDTIKFTRRYNLEFNISEINKYKALKSLRMSNFECNVIKSYMEGCVLITVENITVCQAVQIKSIIKNIKVYD